MVQCRTSCLGILKTVWHVTQAIMALSNPYVDIGRPSRWVEALCSQHLHGFIQCVCHNVCVQELSIAVKPSRDIIVIPLSALTIPHLKALCDALQTSNEQARNTVSQERAMSVFLPQAPVASDVLLDLWKLVVQPIILALGLQVSLSAVSSHREPLISRQAMSRPTASSVVVVPHGTLHLSPYSRRRSLSYLR